MRILILGGTTQASQLARALAGRDDLSPILSLAGRTQNPLPVPIPSRVGGFGGVDGLVAFLREEKIDVVVDATHPFAAQMSAHAARRRASEPKFRCWCSPVPPGRRAKAIDGRRSPTWRRRSPPSAPRPAAFS